MGLITEDELQGRATRLIANEVRLCVSSLVHTLASRPDDGPRLRSAAGSEIADLCWQAVELSCPILDYEEAARQAGWKQAPANVKRPGTWWREKQSDEDIRPPIQETAQGACDFDGLDPYEWEVYEHWAVSDWLADKLAERGERIDKDFAGLTVWARTTTGQAIAMDGVVRDIVRELHGAGG